MRFLSLFVLATLVTIVTSTLAPFARSGTSDGFTPLNPGDSDPFYTSCVSDSSGNCLASIAPAVASSEGTFYIAPVGVASPGNAWFQLVWDDPLLQYWSSIQCTLTMRADQNLVALSINNNNQEFPTVTWIYETEVTVTGFSSGPGFVPNTVDFVVTSGRGTLGLGVTNVACSGTALNACNYAGACVNGTICSGPPGGYPTCTDINNCATGNGGCDDVCVNTYGSWYCESSNDCTTTGCASGYVCSFVAPNHVCVQVSACSQGEPCGVPLLNSCVDVPGSYVCGCQNYTTGLCNSPTQSCECQAFNQCAVGNGACSIYQKCVNQPAAPVQCVDWNQCTVNNGACGAWAICVDRPNNYTLCESYNACSVNWGGCLAVYQSCTNVPFQAPICMSIDFCAEGLVTCTAPFQVCVSVFDGGGVCESVDLCGTQYDTCDPELATCVNRHNEYPLCDPWNACESGYGGCSIVFQECSMPPEGGSYCTYKNMCEIENGHCAEMCQNVNGSLPICINENQCETNNTCKFWQTCNDLPNGLSECIDNDLCENNGNCTLVHTTCVDNHNGSVSCVDVRECDYQNGNCNAYQKCIENVGAAPTCENFNVCTIEHGACPEFTLCVDEINTAPLCLDQNFCATNNNGCDPDLYTCVHVEFGNTTCVPKDLCAEPGICPNSTVCQNTNPGYLCAEPIEVGNGTPDVATASSTPLSTYLIIGGAVLVATFLLIWAGVFFYRRKKLNDQRRRRLERPDVEMVVLEPPSPKGEMVLAFNHDQARPRGETMDIPLDEMPVNVEPIGEVPELAYIPPTPEATQQIVHFHSFVHKDGHGRVRHESSFDAPADLVSKVINQAPIADNEPVPEDGQTEIDLYPTAQINHVVQQLEATPSPPAETDEGQN